MCVRERWRRQGSLIAVIARDRKTNIRAGPRINANAPAKNRCRSGVTSSQAARYAFKLRSQKKGQPMRLIFSVFVVVAVMSVLSVAQETTFKSSPDAAELNKMA